MVGAPWRCGVLTTSWGRACFNSPEWSGSSSPVKTEPPQIVLLLNGYIVLKEQIFVRWADLIDFFSFIFVGKMCVFVSRPMKIVTFLRENEYLPKRVVDFHRERDTFRNNLTNKVTTTTVNPGNRRGFCV